MTYPIGPILQPDSGPVATQAYLRADPAQVLWGRLPCAADGAVLTVESGTSVTIDTISHEGILEDQGRDPRAFFARYGVAPDEVLADAVALAASDHPRRPGTDGPHVVTGPIEVAGALPGDVLTMTVEQTVPRVPYGVISNRHGRGALPGELPAGPDNVSVFTPVTDDPQLGPIGRLPLVEGGERLVAFPLEPFLGIMGVAEAGSQRPHSVPPGPYGGNIDIRLLTVGAKLHLPVRVPGALAYVGDPHFAQGDGEVALTALEASLRVVVRFDLVRAADAAEQFGALAGPLAETTDFLVPTGLDADLDEAMRNCVRAAIALLRARYGMEEHLAYAYLSAATDFNISQVVDLVCGVHARIRKSDFSGLGVL